jgi:hypothetical protein
MGEQVHGPYHAPGIGNSFHPGNSTRCHFSVVKCIIMTARRLLPNASNWRNPQQLQVLTDSSRSRTGGGSIAAFRFTASAEATSASSHTCSPSRSYYTPHNICSFLVRSPSFVASESNSLAF